MVEVHSNWLFQTSAGLAFSKDARFLKVQDTTNDRDYLSQAFSN
jgi:hypothetical protein